MPRVQQICGCMHNARSALISQTVEIGAVMSGLTASRFHVLWYRGFRARGFLRQLKNRGFTRNGSKLPFIALGFDYPITGTIFPR